MDEAALKCISHQNEADVNVVKPNVVSDKAWGFKREIACLISGRQLLPFLAIIIEAELPFHDFIYSQTLRAPDNEIVIRYHIN